RGRAGAAGRAGAVGRAGRGQALVEVGVQVALLLVQGLAAVLELLDPAAQLSQAALGLIQALRGLDLIGRDALDAGDALLQVVELDLHRVLIRWGAGAAGDERHQRHGEEDRAHCGSLATWPAAAASDRRFPRAGSWPRPPRRVRARPAAPRRSSPWRSA